MSKKLRIIFAGTNQFAASHLNTLLSFGYKIIGVLTKPNKPSGRGVKLIPNPIKVLAERKGLPVFQPISLFTQENQQWIATLDADVIVVVAYGLILPKAVLNMPRLCCINVHGSLLPRWRGAAPIQRALLAGDRKTGITIIHMNTGLDTGNILCKLECLIKADDTSASLYEKLAELGSKGLIITLQQLAEGTITSEVQCERLATYAKKLSRKEAEIDWSLSAIQLERCVRAFNPWPVSWFMIKGQQIKIWKASVIQKQINTKPGTILKTSKSGIQIATVDNILNLELLQPAGKRVMSVQELLNSRREWFIPGMCLA